MWVAIICCVSAVGLLPESGLARQDETKVQAAIDAVTAAGGKVLVVAADCPERDVIFHLAARPVEDAHLAPLAEIPHVVSLNLRGAAVTDDGLKHLAGLPELRRLHLEKTAITDKGLAHVAGLSELEYLNLYGTKVTDEGIKQLAALKKLKRLYVWQTGVTESGMAELKQALPDLQIIAGLSLSTPPAESEPKESPATDKPEEKKAGAGDDRGDG
jgi:hypothetical protein